MRQQAFISRTDAAWVVAFTALFAAAIGVANGEANHLVYLLPGMHAANPEFLSADWFVTQVEHPHFVFNAAVAALARNGLLVVGLTVGTLAQSIVLALSVWAIARQFYDAPQIPWAMTLMVLGATGTHSVGLTLLTGPQLEASTIAGVAFVAGLALLGSHRYQSCAGLPLGLAALFHAHFAVLLVPVVLVGAVLVARRDGWFRGLAILAPFLVLGIPSFLQVIAHRADPTVAMANDLMLMRFPHHYDPRTWGVTQGGLFAGILITGGAGVILRRPAHRPVLMAAVGVMALMASVALAASYGGLSKTLMLLAPWRLGSVVILFAILAATAASVRPQQLGRAQRPFLFGGLLAVAIASVVATVFGPIPPRVGVAVVAAVVAGFWSERLSHSSGRSDVRRRLAVVITILAGFMPTVWHSIDRSHFDIRPAAIQEPELYSWIAAGTPPDAVFAVPPGWIDFRLVGRRSIVADHKSPPTRPTELMAWVARIEMLSGLPPRGEAAELDAGFLAMDCGRALLLRDKFDVRFVIRPSDAPACGRTAHSEGAFSVVDLTELGTAIEGP